MPMSALGALLQEPGLVHLCRGRHKWIYADPGTMPRRPQRDANAVGGAGFWGRPGWRCSA
jgi:hypothetical protein